MASNWQKMIVSITVVAGATAPAAQAQATAAPICTAASPANELPNYTSAETGLDGRVTFRLCAPDAHDVVLTSGDIAR